jgi:hypothetical protein
MLHCLDCEQQLSDENEDDAYERREAELQFIECAYSSDECWMERFEGGGSDTINISSVGKIIAQIKRRLVVSVPTAAPKSCENPSSTINTQLHGNGKGVLSSSSIILTISIPEGYPVKEDEVVQLEASITGQTMAPSLQKLAVNALPSLLAACRREARKYSGCEALHPILSCAESWIENEWRDIVS